MSENIEIIPLGTLNSAVNIKISFASEKHFYYFISIRKFNLLIWVTFMIDIFYHQCRLPLGILLEYRNETKIIMKGCQVPLIVLFMYRW